MFAGTCKWGPQRAQYNMRFAHQFEEDWQQLLMRPEIAKSSEQLSSFHSDKTVLITGAGGSIGSALAVEVMQSRPRNLLLLDVSEQNLYRLQIQLKRIDRNMPTVSILGSVTDRDLLDELFRRHRPDLVYHAAAHKHVPLMEGHPFAAISNNVIGTHHLALAAVQFQIPHLLMISTDKAADPISIMGASKRIAELTLSMVRNDRTKMHSIRLGNVLGSEGSVVPCFLDQIDGGGPVTVTDRDAERYFLTMRESISLIFEAANYGDAQPTLVPEPGKPVRILDLAKYLIEKHSTPGCRIPIVITGLRPGDKMRERFVASDEWLGEKVSGHLRRVDCTLPSAEIFASTMLDLERAVHARHLGEMLQLVQRLVPQYKPGAHLACGVAAMVDLHV